MKSVMLSINHKYCELIANGKKTIEVRKTRPKIETPFKCLIYECKGKKVSKIIDIPKEQGGGVLDYYEYEGCGKVIGEFVCDCIIPISITYSDPNNRIAQNEFPYTCLTDKEIKDYLGNGKQGYGWHISKLVINDKPKELSEFMVIDKEMLEECPYRERICQNPEYCNGNYLLGGYSCYKVKEPEFDDIDFCKGGCSDVFKPLTRPPQSWCYVEVE